MVKILEAKVRHVAGLQQREIVQKHKGLERFFGRLVNAIAIFSDRAQKT